MSSFSSKESKVMILRPTFRASIVEVLKTAMSVGGFAIAVFALTLKVEGTKTLDGSTEASIQSPIADIYLKRQNYEKIEWYEYKDAGINSVKNFTTNIQNIRRAVASCIDINSDDDL